MIEQKPLSRKIGYQEVVDRTGFVEHQDFNPIIVDNVFTEEQINHIYNTINHEPLDKVKVAPWGGQASWFSTHFRGDIEARISDIILDVVDGDLELRGDYSFARYSEEFGYKTKLFPHADKREKPRFLMDVQLRADTDWAIVIEDTEYVLKNNQGIIFSGTNQVHWREPKDIGPHARVDMIFFNLEFKDGRGFEPHHSDSITQRSRYLRDFYQLEDTPRPVDRKFNELQ